jgi:hypothetical protein
MLGSRAANAAPGLIRLFDDKYEANQLAAARALGRLGAIDAQHVEAVEGKLDSRDSKEALIAARALGFMGPAAAAAAPTLMRIATESTGKLAAKAIESLVSMGASIQPSLPVMADKLRADDPDVKQRSLKTVAAIATYARSIADSVQACTSDPDPTTREAARETLERIKNAQLSGMSR